MGNPPAMRRLLDPEHSHVWISPGAARGNKVYLEKPEPLHESAALLPVVRLRKAHMDTWRPDAYDYHRVDIDGPSELLFIPHRDIDPNLWVRVDEGVEANGVWLEEPFDIQPTNGKNIVYVLQKELLDQKKVTDPGIDPHDVEWRPVLEIHRPDGSVDSCLSIRIDGPSRVVYGGPAAKPHTLWVEFDADTAYSYLEPQKWVEPPEPPQRIGQPEIATIGTEAQAAALLQQAQQNQRMLSLLDRLLVVVEAVVTQKLGVQLPPSASQLSSVPGAYQQTKRNIPVSTPPEAGKDSTHVHGPGCPPQGINISFGNKT